MPKRAAVARATTTISARRAACTLLVAVAPAHVRGCGAGRSGADDPATGGATSRLTVL